jgi:hypothetical protein
MHGGNHNRMVSCGAAIFWKTQDLRTVAITQPRETVGTTNTIQH